jgi:hypothetical protein
MHRAAIVLAVFLSLAAGYAPGQSKDKGLDTLLAGVTERGRALYAYDQAAWHGSDALMALHPDTKGLSRYICRKTPAGWVVSVGKWNDAHDQFLVLYEAVQSPKSTKFEARKLDPPVKAKDELTGMERAQELAIKEFVGEKRPYNVAILPAPAGNLYVYVYPGQTKEAVWPIGGDVRYTISADGKQILEKRQLHKAIMDMEYNPDKLPAAGVHMHLQSDVPEDTDVLYVLTRQPSIPEYIMINPEKMFIVSTNGSIELQDPCAKQKAAGQPCNLKPEAPQSDAPKTQN